MDDWLGLAKTDAPPLKFITNFFVVRSTSFEIFSGFPMWKPGSAFDLILQTSEFDQLSRVLIVFEEISMDNDKFEICILCQQNQHKGIEWGLPSRDRKNVIPFWEPRRKGLNDNKMYALCKM